MKEDGLYAILFQTLSFLTSFVPSCFCSKFSFVLVLLFAATFRTHDVGRRLSSDVLYVSILEVKSTFIAYILCGKFMRPEIYAKSTKTQVSAFLSEKYCSEYL